MESYKRVHTALRLLFHLLAAGDVSKDNAHYLSAAILTSGDYELCRKDFFVPTHEAQFPCEASVLPPLPTCRLQGRALRIEQRSKTGKRYLLARTLEYVTGLCICCQNTILTAHQKHTVGRSFKQDAVKEVILLGFHLAHSFAP